MQKFIFYTLLLSVVVTVIFVYKQNLQIKKSSKGNISKDKVTRILKFPNGKQIYVHARAWGVSSNHEEIVFSENQIIVPNKEKDYIFYTSEVYYKLERNVLTLYAPQNAKNIPKAFDKKIDICFKGLKTAFDINNYKKNYREYGLEKISIYPD